MSQHAHKPYLHTRQRKSSILNAVSVSTTSGGDPLCKHPGLQLSNSRVSSTRTPHSRLLNLTLPFLNLPGSRIRKASPTVSLTHANVNVNAAAASCINIDIINIDQCSITQQQHDYHDHCLSSINVYHDNLPCQLQNINVIPFPSSAPVSCPASEWVSLTHQNVDVDVKTPSSLEQPPPYSHRRTPRKALAVSNSKTQSGRKNSGRRSKAKHVRADAGSSPSSSRKSHKRLAADIQFLETIHRSVASHRAERRYQAGGDGEKDEDAVMDAQECLLLQHLSDVMIELGHRVPTTLSCNPPSPVPSSAPSSEVGRETEEDTRVELTSPDDCSPPSLPISLPVPRSLPPQSRTTPIVSPPAFPARPPGLSLLTRTPRAPVLPIALTSPAPTVSPPLSSPPLRTISLSSPVLSMPQLVAALTLRRRERRGGAEGRGRRQECGGVHEAGRKSGLGVEVRVEGGEEDA